MNYTKWVQQFSICIALWFLFLMKHPFVYSYELGSNNKSIYFSLSGYYKNLFIGYKTNEYYDNSTYPQSKLLLTDVNRIRLSPNCDIGNTIAFHADIDNEIIVSNYTQSKTFEASYIGFSYNELYTDSYDYQNDDMYYRFKLHRAYIKAVAGKSTITVGKQLVRFGSGKIWNPLDIVNPISPIRFEGAEETKGVNALRLELYPANFFEIGFVYVPQRKNNELYSSSFSTSVYLLRNKIVIGSTEVAFLVGNIIERNIVGADIATTVHDGLLRVSVLGNKIDGHVYYVGGAGYEYSFEWGLTLLLEYFYNGYCLNKNPELLNAYYESIQYGMNQKRYGAVAYNFLTFNEHYAGISIMFSGASLFSLQATAIVDFQGKGVIGIPTASYNIIEDCDLMFYLMYAIVTGNKPSDFSSFDKKPFIAFELKYYF